LADVGFKLIPLTETEVIGIFLKKHPEIKRVEWKDEKLIAWYWGGSVANIGISGPFKAEDFEVNSPERDLLEELTIKLVMVKDRHDRQQNKSTGISEKIE
jgi:hypothetical protein